MNHSFSRSYPSADDSPGFLLWQASNAWQRQQRAALEPLGITHVQFVLLAGIAWLSGRSADPITQTQLAQHTRSDLMMVSEVARTLAGKGLLERAPHPRDSRAKSLRITGAGQELVQRAIGVVEAVDRRFFAGLGGRQPELNAALRQLRDQDGGAEADGDG
ncbi:MAG TPA: MarR family transcriptional regulator [Herpetosiphonaceae bacterium]|nr:MarR family transcriptional regulator [Herpetosiphonaceae bacterium]